MKLSPEFLSLARPGATGRVRSENWIQIEKRSGSLPVEYKLILSTVGHGAYGCFIFVHPDVERDFLNLHRAQEDGWNDLISWCPQALAAIGTDRPLILGYGPERHTLVWVSGVYWLIDTELDEAHALGGCVSDWLVRQFRRAVENLDGKEIGNSLWSTGSGMPKSFFDPCANLM